MLPKYHPPMWVRLERLITTAGLNLAGSGLLAMLLCAAGLRGTGTLFADWGVLASSLAPAAGLTWRRLAPLFWRAPRLRDRSMSSR